MANTFSFLKPTTKSLAIFTLLVFICIGGAIQSYAFIDDIPEIPKPPLYDLLKPLELWTPWIFFTFPIHLLGSLLGLWWLLKYFPKLGGINIPIASLAYAYIISCWTVHSWDCWARHSKHGRLAPLVGVILASIPYLPIIPLLAVNPIDYATFAISGFTFLAIVSAVYTISIYGLYKASKTLLQSHKTRETT